MSNVLLSLHSSQWSIYIDANIALTSTLLSLSVERSDCDHIAILVRPYDSLLIIYLKPQL